MKMIPLTALLFSSVMWVTSAWAGPVKIDHSPLKFQRAQLTVSGPNGEADVWKRWPILLATRVNGKAHTRRKRGPIQFVLPMSDDAAIGQDHYQNNWVWMAARIEAIYE